MTPESETLILIFYIFTINMQTTYWQSDNRMGRMAPHH